MSKENEEVIENDDKVDEIEDIVETKDDDGNDTTDWKALALNRQDSAKKNQSIAEKRQGIAKRYKTKLEKFNEKPDEKPDKKEPPKSENKDGLDYGQKAFLIANGIKGSKETDFVQGELKKAGGELDGLLENEYFKDRLKEFREINKTSEATPKGTRSGKSTDSIEYWMTKPMEEVPKELRTEVVNAKLKKDKKKTHFYNSD